MSMPVTGPLSQPPVHTLPTVNQAYVVQKFGCAFLNVQFPLPASWKCESGKDIANPEGGGLIFCYDAPTLASALENIEIKFYREMTSADVDVQAFSSDFKYTMLEKSKNTLLISHSSSTDDIYQMHICADDGTGCTIDYFARRHCSRQINFPEIMKAVEWAIIENPQSVHEIMG